MDDFGGTSLSCVPTIGFLIVFFQSVFDIFGRSLRLKTQQFVFHSDPDFPSCGSPGKSKTEKVIYFTFAVLGKQAGLRLT